jgi:ABC-2 type transport system ATP-binding protein
VVVIADGRLRGAGSLDAVLGGADETFVRSPAVPELATLVAGARSGVVIVPDGADGLIVSGSSPASVGRVAAEHGVALIELRPHRASLEDAFLALTGAER